MTTIDSAIIAKHTTSSTPQPHVIYIIEVTHDNGAIFEVQRRFSDFVALKLALGDCFPLPPKRTITTSVVPCAWMDDRLIEERKRGLQMYLTYLLHDLARRRDPELARFLAPGYYRYIGRLSAANNAKDGPGGEQVTTPSMIQAKSALASSYMRSGGANAAGTDEDRKKPIAASYYPSWAADTLPPSKIDFSKFDVIFFAFVTPNGTAGINWDDGSEKVLQNLVVAARQSGHSTKIVLSVGGWGGCHWFSQVMSTSSNRTKFANTLVNTVNTYGLDGKATTMMSSQLQTYLDLEGIDIDWEYPNAEGNGNPHSSADTANLLSFFKMLRDTFGPTKIISAAVTQLPWLGPDSAPLTDVSAFAAQMTYVNIMNYDVFGASSNPGPNAPLGGGNLCGSSTQPKATAQAAFAQWTKAGMPASKLLLGLPLYGYVSKSSSKKLSGSLIPTPNDPRFPPGAHPRHPPISANGAQGDLSHLWGQQIAFSQIISFGALTQNSDGSYGGVNGYTMGWDDCSDTPYLFNTAQTTVVTYDDTWSIASKTQFAKKSGMAGCFTWSMDQDDGLALHNIILHNLRK
ncbi:unnamed protein product [Cyclocybe aegerita]|uniref:Chitinase n=1 Tax=Cyclocybe aegerita TaxID=1973307 RepID=A0A8S0W378_CYCAE|nr:unnamed protein product [Cyclocybe aegerita]